MKRVSTSDGMDLVRTSPFLDKRIKRLPEKLEEMRHALQTKNFTLFGEITEEDCLDMHHVMQTQKPPLIYWNDMTRTIMDAVLSWRNGGLPVYFTVDAGPNVHVICEGQHAEAVMEKIKTLSGIVEVIHNKPAGGAYMVDSHLF